MGEIVSAVSVSCAGTGHSTRLNRLGMRPMQERVWEQRGEQYLLIKSPPASGKSRALMFVALDKLHNQGLRKAIVTVPEKSIGSNFAGEPLSRFGFWADWRVEAAWNLCDAPGGEEGKVGAVGAFLKSDDRVLVTTHATFRFAMDRFGAKAFDDCLLAVDEFHHVSANPDNKLGAHMARLIARNKAHVVAMTGSYFRGDTVPVLTPEDEARFETVTYTYYEQLNGYTFLKALDIGYFFYSGAWSDHIMQVLDPDEKTIVHIPAVNSRESTKDKIREVEHIVESLGAWQGTDPATGFQLVQRPDGRVLRIADLVDDDPAKRDRVLAALRDPAGKQNRDHVDIIIALGMAKEGFDWIWCAHALTVGYRSSLTEVVQIIGRVTRDAEGKTRARFTNLIAEPDASGEDVTEAVNDTLKAIAASLLMEQVLAPRFNFTPRVTPDSPQADGASGAFTPGATPEDPQAGGTSHGAFTPGVTPDGPQAGAGHGAFTPGATPDGPQAGARHGAFTPGVTPDGPQAGAGHGAFTPGVTPDGPQAGAGHGDVGLAPASAAPAPASAPSASETVGFNAETGQFQIAIKGLVTPKSKAAQRICQQDLNEVIAAFVQDKTVVERGLFDEDMVPEEFTDVRMGKIVRDKYPGLDRQDREAVRQHAVAAMYMARKIKAAGVEARPEAGNTALIEGVRKFAMDVRELDIDLIEGINPFGDAYAILAKAMSEESLQQVAAIISAKKVKLTLEEARQLAGHARNFKQERGRLPSATSSDPWERCMADGVNFLASMRRKAMKQEAMKQEAARD